jgi:hypothetical protein
MYPYATKLSKKYVIMVVVEIVKFMGIEVESHGELKRKLPYQQKPVIILLFN